VRLEPLYRATWVTRESWSVELTGEAGTEGRSFFIAEGRTEGRLSARLRAANYARRRVDGTLTPDFRGALETDDGASVLFSWQGYARAGAGEVREIVGSITHETDDERYRWLNNKIGAVVGEVRSREAGGSEIVIDVAELVWEPIEAHRSTRA
jgi:Protein of unknown function (DUF3237)